jgi:eukaryotic-like serine/threonine-protein kinase
MHRSFLPRMITASGGLSGELPLDLQRDGARRLGIAALIYAGAFAVMGTWGRALAVHHGHITFGEAFGPRYLPAVLSIAFALGVYALTRSWRAHPGRLLDLGLVFLVISTFGIAFDTNWGAFSRWDDAERALVDSMRLPFGVPYESIWILIYPVLVPNRPWKILVAGLTAASLSMVVLALSRSAGLTAPQLSIWQLFIGQFLFTNHACAVMAWIVSRTVYSMGKHLQRAQEVGQYRMVEKLGEGGMGEVWRAEHQMLARPAAVKLIRPQALGASAIEAERAILRFEREARATAALRNLHTITVYDFGVNDEGAFYYVMELLDGIDLETLVREHGPLPAARVIALLRHACRSLGEAHRAGLVHRDVKPANLFTCRVDDRVDWLKVLDFGLVKGEVANASGDTRLTQQGTFAGTPAFLAPEMLTGKDEIDGRADLYSLGCVAYWLLTGQNVFDGGTPLSVAIDHAKSDPVPLSQRTEMPIPAELEALVLKCLQKDPGARPQTADELEHALADLAGRHPWTQETALRWWDRHRPARVATSTMGSTPPGP